MWIPYLVLKTVCLGIDEPDVMVSGNDAGIEKVIAANGKYAFFMESSAIEYNIERKCALSQVTPELARIPYLSSG